VTGEPGCRCKALVSWALFEDALVGSVTDGPYGGENKKKHQKRIYRAALLPCVNAAKYGQNWTRLDPRHPDSHPNPDGGARQVWGVPKYLLQTCK